MKAVAAGYDVRGIFYWTLMDNVEWHEGFRMKFGLYKWCPVQQRSGGELHLRQGSRALIEQHRSIPSNLEAVKRYAISCWQKGAEFLST